MTGKTIGDSMTILEGVVQQSDLNGYGLMHGGRLLTLCDEVGYMAAKKHCKCDCLTRAAHEVMFDAFMRQGDTYKIEARVVLAGFTTLWVQCQVLHDGKTVMRSVFVYIAVDKQLHVIPVPEVVPASDEEKAEQERMERLRNRIMGKVEER